MIITAQGDLGSRYLVPMSKYESEQLSESHWSDVCKVSALLHRELRSNIVGKSHRALIIKINDALFIDLLDMIPRKSRNGRLKKHKLTLADAVTAWTDDSRGFLFQEDTLFLTACVHLISLGDDQIGYGIHLNETRYSSYLYFPIEKVEKFNSEREYAMDFLANFRALLLQRKFLEG